MECCSWHFDFGISDAASLFKGSIAVCIKADKRKAAGDYLLHIPCPFFTLLCKCRLCLNTSKPIRGEIQLISTLDLNLSLPSMIGVLFFLMKTENRFMQSAMHTLYLASFSKINNWHLCRQIVPVGNQTC